MEVDERDASAEAGPSMPAVPPRENLIRAIMPGFELRENGDGGMPTLAGRFAVFNQWTEIDSLFEGRFMERIAPGAFKKTFRENGRQIKVLFQHGRDPQIGDKVLGPVADLREDDEGAYYEVPLLDTSYNRDLIPGLEAGLYGASFRFQVMKDEFEQKPSRSVHNPDGIPERTITEARVSEFGPVTFPAYEGATAGIRSLTDEFMLARLVADPDRLRELIARTGLVTAAARDSVVEPEPSEATTPDTTEPEPSEATTRPEYRAPRAPRQKRKRDSQRLRPTTNTRRSR